MAEVTFSQEDLETFKWDETIPDLELFSDKAEEKVEKTETKEDTVVDKTTEEQAEDIDLFGETKGSDEEENNNDKEDFSEKTSKAGDEPTKDKGEPLSKIQIATFLKDKGIIDFELEEGEELDEVDAEDIIESGFEASVESRLEETLQELPDSVKNLIKFVSKGGNPEEYFTTVASSVQGGITTKLDISDEGNQEKFMKFQLKQDGHDDEFIDFQIEAMKDSGKLESMSTKAFNKWKSEQTKRDQELVERQEKAAQLARQNQIEYKKNITKTLAETKNINNLKFSKVDSRELPEYITNPSVTLENGKKISPFHSDLYETMKDPQKVLVLAKLVKNGFDFKDIEKAVADKQAKDLKSNIQRQKTGMTINSAGGSSQPKRLADYFPD